MSITRSQNGVAQFPWARISWEDSQKAAKNLGDENHGHYDTMTSHVSWETSWKFWTGHIAHRSTHSSLASNQQVFSTKQTLFRATIMHILQGCTNQSHSKFNYPGAQCTAIAIAFACQMQEESPSLWTNHSIDQCLQVRKKQ